MHHSMCPPGCAWPGASSSCAVRGASGLTLSPSHTLTSSHPALLSCSPFSHSCPGRPPLQHPATAHTAGDAHVGGATLPCRTAVSDPRGRRRSRRGSQRAALAPSVGWAAAFRRHRWRRGRRRGRGRGVGAACVTAGRDAKVGSSAGLAAARAVHGDAAGGHGRACGGCQDCAAAGRVYAPVSIPLCHRRAVQHPAGAHTHAHRCVACA
mmetsp:Transcript_41390/g.123583  ORF Transcript_41390/g.123583 Transcript_41390/m.123583 type:complete len:209 (+) Transcript_41390:82-708(+)|eukprot:272231-Chlamydomonas_euryale.AAC.4